ncbi:MAG: hypothetical protein ACXVCX_11345, partial [Ktedonobacterales bacterium]
SSPYARPGAVGAILAAAVFVAVLLGGHFSLLAPPQFAGDFYDTQAHSLLHLRWNVPAGSLSFEGFQIHGKIYEYFGPLPALMRLPIAAVTHRLDGRLDNLSMLLAFAVALTFTVRLMWRLRPLVRGAEPFTRGEQWAVGAFTFVADEARAWAGQKATHPRSDAPHFRMHVLPNQPTHNYVYNYGQSIHVLPHTPQAPQSRKLIQTRRMGGRAGRMIAACRLLFVTAS